MKDRWKILIACLVIGGILSIVFLFLGFSFKTVGLREYGILQYTFYRTVDASQTVRESGNYLVGIDFGFIPYPKGILKHQFTVNTLTKDKSMINMEGLFLSQLIESEILNMHFNYGPAEYFKIVKSSVEEAVRQSLQQFLLTEIISQRTSVNSYVSSNVCLNIESQYSFIDCQYVSTGAFTINASPLMLNPQITVQQFLKKNIEETIKSQKKMNIYGNGGFDLIQQVEDLNAQLFLNTTNLVISTIGNFTTEGSEIFAGATYIFQNSLMPILNNQIKAFSISDN